MFQIMFLILSYVISKSNITSKVSEKKGLRIKGGLVFKTVANAPKKKD